MFMYDFMSVRKNFRVSEEEAFVLKLYCQQKDRSETDVVRELIRTLKKKLTAEYKDLLANSKK